MTPDERGELLKDASDLAYVAIKFSGLYKELSSSEWDELASQWGAHLVQLLEARVDEELTRLESEKSAKEVADVI